MTVASLAVVHPPLAVAPPIETLYTKPIQLPPVRTIEDLYQLRDRLKAELAQSGISIAPKPTSEPRLELLQLVEIRIQVEETAQRNWDDAGAASQRAQDAMNAANRLDDSSLGTLNKIFGLWLRAVNSLKAVPTQSLVATAAAVKEKEYSTYLQQASSDIENSDSDFLKAVVEGTGLPLNDIHITVCDINNDCRHWNGSTRPADPASLIKVPIAIAVLQKLADENIDLNTKILINPNNYTEDASSIGVGTNYTLREILARMIDQSSNIATNQLIDYMGRDKINQILRDRGYPVTSVYTKLVGESTYPADPGDKPNATTTDELTEMMRQIYLRERPSDKLLIDVLANQHDTALGQDGLKDTRAVWMGEKTGQNSKVLGSMLAMKIGGEVYLLSIALDNSGDESAIRQCVSEIAEQIASRGRL